MITFIAFLAATFAWILEMPALFVVSVIALIASSALYIHDRLKSKHKSA
jgi:hypothetical protein